MARITNKIDIPKGTEVNLSGQKITVKGAKGELNFALNESIEMVKSDEGVHFEPKSGISDKELKKLIPLTGTTKAIVNNMLTGVSVGFEKQLKLIGVGYRTQVQGSKVTLNLGFSHPIEHQLPDGITAEAPSQTDLVIRGIDKQAVGQVAANIRAYRPPEPYKGKGVRYADEYVARKDAKKK
ncbi:MAG: 50S ribosomal protein L6 [Gammaproteobacteria bacterium]|nr:50S ribosomal protein L6 [Gammaproteobacteria bacterium]